VARHSNRQAVRPVPRAVCGPRHSTDLVDRRNGPHIIARSAVGCRLQSSAVIRQYLPMAPTLVREPFHRAGWIYEEKVDGWRMLACKEGARVRLVSRNGVDHTRRFHDIATAISKLSARTLVLDGEVAIFDEQLRSRFDWLREPDPEAVATPPLPDGLRHRLPQRARPLRAAAP